MKFSGKMSVIIILKVSILSLEIHFSEKHRGNCSSVFEIILCFLVVPYRKKKKSAKNDDFFLPAMNFFADYFFTIFLPTINFYRGIFLPTFFLQARTFSIF